MYRAQLTRLVGAAFIHAVSSLLIGALERSHNYFNALMDIGLPVIWNRKLRLYLTDCQLFVEIIIAADNIQALVIATFSGIGELTAL